MSERMERQTGESSSSAVKDNEDGRNQKKFIRYLRNVWLGVDCFNLFDISNVSSYYWVTDVTNQQYAVPNYLTGRQINARILIEL